jgi:hypothetical protein
MNTRVARVPGSLLRSSRCHPTSGVICPDHRQCSVSERRLRERDCDDKRGKGESRARGPRRAPGRHVAAGPGGQRCPCEQSSAGDR